MSSFLSLCSARYELPPARPPVTEQHSNGCAASVSGTDADYPESGVPQRRKAQRHWLAVWRTEEDVDRFMSSPTAHLPELAGAHRVAGLKLLPYMQRGAEVLPLAFDRVRPRPDQPVAIITSIGPYASESDAIAAGQRASLARQSLSDAAGLTRELLIIPFPPMATDLFTVTTWRNEPAAQEWAYRGSSHGSAMAFYKDTHEKARVSFTRCLIAGAFGDW
jgi:hypothetical protein